MTEAEYMADVQQRGGWYVRELFTGAWPLRSSTVGFPGAGFVEPRSPSGGARYELAPWSVAMHVVSPFKLLSYPLDQSPTATQATADASAQVQDIANGLPSVPSLAGSVLGLPPIVVTAILLFVAYAALQGAGIVPPIKKVIR